MLNNYLSAPPVFEHNRNSIPIPVIGQPVIITSNKTRHCLHGPSNTRILVRNNDRVPLPFSVEMLVGATSAEINQRAVSREGGVYLRFPSCPGTATMGKGKEEQSTIC